MDQSPSGSQKHNSPGRNTREQPFPSQAILPTQRSNLYQSLKHFPPLSSLPWRPTTALAPPSPVHPQFPTQWRSTTTTTTTTSVKGAQELDAGNSEVGNRVSQCAASARRGRLRGGKIPPSGALGAHLARAAPRQHERNALRRTRKPSSSRCPSGAFLRKTRTPRGGSRKMSDSEGRGTQPPRPEEGHSNPIQNLGHRRPAHTVAVPGGASYGASCYRPRGTERIAARAPAASFRDSKSLSLLSHPSMHQ